jgi:hypothetical protein
MSAKIQENELTLQDSPFGSLLEKKKTFYSTGLEYNTKSFSLNATAGAIVYLKEWDPHYEKIIGERAVYTLW